MTSGRFAPGAPAASRAFVEGDDRAVVFRFVCEAGFRLVRDFPVVAGVPAVPEGAVAPSSATSVALTGSPSWSVRPFSWASSVVSSTSRCLSSLGPGITEVVSCTPASTLSTALSVAAAVMAAPSVAAAVMAPATAAVMALPAREPGAGSWGTGTGWTSGAAGLAGRDAGRWIFDARWRDEARRRGSGAVAPTALSRLVSGGLLAGAPSGGRPGFSGAAAAAVGTAAEASNEAGSTVIHSDGPSWFAFLLFFAAAGVPGVVAPGVVSLVAPGAALGSSAGWEASTGGGASASGALPATWSSRAEKVARAAASPPGVGALRTTESVVPSTSFPSEAVSSPTVGGRADPAWTDPAWTDLSRDGASAVALAALAGPRDVPGAVRTALAGPGGAPGSFTAGRLRGGATGGSGFLNPFSHDPRLASEPLDAAAYRPASEPGSWLAGDAEDRDADPEEEPEEEPSPEGTVTFRWNTSRAKKPAIPPFLTRSA